MIRFREAADVHDGANCTSFWTPPSPPTNSSITDNIGDPLPAHKPPNTTRVYFANVNGLQYGAQGGDFATICNTMHSSHIDILGLVETKLDSNLPYVMASCTRAARRTFRFSRVVLSSSAIRYNNSFKPGGTGLVLADHVTGRIITTYRDSMGRWSAVSLRGAKTSKLAIVCAYQVCLSTSRISTGHTQTSGSSLWRQ
jgi:hypothetical protein